MKVSIVLVAGETSRIEAKMHSNMHIQYIAPTSSSSCGHTHTSLRIQIGIIHLLSGNLVSTSDLVSSEPQKQVMRAVAIPIQGLVPVCRVSTLGA
jgi:hypothetical protein